MLVPPQSLQVLLRRLCWQMLAPPQSLQVLLLRLCWQMLVPPQSKHTSDSSGHNVAAQPPAHRAMRRAMPPHPCTPPGKLVRDILRACAGQPHSVLCSSPPPLCEARPLSFGGCTFLPFSLGPTGDRDCPSGGRRAWDLCPLFVPARTGGNRGDHPELSFKSWGHCPPPFHNMRLCGRPGGDPRPGNISGPSQTRA